MQYLKIYDDVIESGRDMGYPCTEERIYSNIDDLARDYGTKKNERYYELTPVDYGKLRKAVEDSKKAQNKKEKEEERKRKLKEYNKLKKELNIKD